MRSAPHTATGRYILWQIIDVFVKCPCNVDDIYLVMTVITVKTNLLSLAVGMKTLLYGAFVSCCGWLAELMAVPSLAIVLFNAQHLEFYSN